MQAEYQKRADLISAKLKALPTVQTQTFVPPVANRVPHLVISYDQSKIKISASDVKKQMRAGKPRIELNPSTGGAPASAGLPGGSNVIVVGVWMLQPGEDAIVAERLHQVLHAALSS